MSSLGDELRAAMAKRDGIATRLEKLRATEAALDAERQHADRDADAAATKCRDARGARAAGETVDLETAIATRDATAHRLTELVESGEALESRIEAMEVEFDTARRAAAHVRERLAVSVSGYRETKLRATALAFAVAKKRWHQSAQGAADAHHEWSGQIGVESVPHTGFRAALLMTNFDDGLKAIFGRNGLTESLQPVHIRGLSERELLDADTDETHTEETPSCPMQ